jgi:hypothetical protein
VTSPSGAIFNVVGKPALSMKIVFWFLLLYIPVLLVTSRFGLIELALGFDGSRVIVGLVSLYMSLDLIDESRWRVTEELARSLLAGVVMAAAAWGGNVFLIEQGVPIPVRIAVVGVLGALVFWIAARLIARRAFDETVALFKQLLRRRRRPAAEVA